MPEFFIVGSPKTGTTSLYQTLRSHPQIFMPALKEPRFLATDMRPRAGFAHDQRELGYPDTLEDYLALFDGAAPDQRAGEASTFYLWSRTAAEQIHELQPDARIIAIIREPASFLRSLHNMYLQWRVESERDLREALALEAARREGRRIPRHSHRPQLLQYAEHVRYVEQLRRYHERFGRERVLVVIYDDFLADGEATVREVLRFLDVDDALVPELANVNVTRQTVRSWGAKDLLGSATKGRAPLARSARTAVKALTTQRLRRRAAGAFQRQVVVAPAPAAEEGLTLELKRRFKGEVVALSAYIERDLVALWGYEEID